MGAICGILGKRDLKVVRAMANALAHRGDLSHQAEGNTYCVASSTPIPTNTTCAVDGTPRRPDGQRLTPEEVRRLCTNGAGADAGPTGPFAAAFATEQDDEWGLARDRLGRKPLYYFQGQDFLLFASELKALLASGLVPKRLNLHSVDRYLTLRCVPGPESIIRDVYRVKPGHVTIYRNGRTTETAFAGFESGSREVPRDEAARTVRTLLETALSQSDAGTVLWSSGLDCAALAALKPELRPVFAQLARAWQRETRMAKESARRLGIALETAHAKSLTEETFGRVVRALDEPIADASVFPLWLIAEAVSEHATAAVSGHGADALLGGFPRYHFLQKAHGARPLVPVGLVGSILPALPPNAFVRRGSRYLAAIRDNVQAYLSLVSVFDQEEREELYTDAMKAALPAPDDPLPFVRDLFGASDLTQNLLSLDLNVGLPDLEIAKCDRIAAANGLDLQLPYLHDGLVDYLTGLSPKTRFGVRSKPLLRTAMKGLVPPGIRLRARRGFHIPQSGRVVRVIENVTRQTLTPERIDATGLFKWPQVERIIQSASHNLYRRRQFWAMLMFFAWYEQVMEA